jgi:hypothetical protein
VPCDGRTLHLTNQSQMSLQGILNEAQAMGEAVFPLDDRLSY